MTNYFGYLTSVNIQKKYKSSFANIFNSITFFYGCDEMMRLISADRSGIFTTQPRATDK